VIAVVKDKILEGDVQDVIVASESGKTVLAVAEALKDMDVRVICVAPYAGYQYVLKRTWPPMKNIIKSKLVCFGVKIVDQTPWIFGCTFDTAARARALSEHLIDVMKQAGKDEPI